MAEQENFPDIIMGSVAPKARLRCMMRPAYLSTREATRRDAGCSCVRCRTAHVGLDDTVETDKMADIITGERPLIGRCLHVNLDNGRACQLRHAAGRWHRASRRPGQANRHMLPRNRVKAHWLLDHGQFAARSGLKPSLPAADW